MRELLVALIAIAILFTAGTAAIEAQWQASGDRFDVANETWDPDAGNVSELNESNLESAEYDTRVHVEDSTGRKMIEGDDYVWYESNGTVKATESGRLAVDENASISYGYTVPSETQNEMVQLWNSAGTVIPGILFLLMVFIVIAAIAAFGRG